MQEFAPSDDEFAALRAGEEWDPEKARLKAEKVGGLSCVKFISGMLHYECIAPNVDINQSPEWTILSHVSCFVQGEVH